MHLSVMDLKSLQKIIIVILNTEDKVILVDESIKVFYFENNNEINFSIIRKNNINNKSHVVNINDMQAFHSELNRALKI